jgi:hypothetical protein
MVFLVAGQNMRLIHIQEMPSLQDCMARAMAINDERGSPYNGACYPTNRGAT